MAQDNLFLRACRNEETDRIPIWIMRQAGRYLPEYREVRSRVSFLDLCHTPDLIREVTLQPIRRFGFDAAIIFSDILTPLEPMGLEVAFGEEGPVIGNPVRTRSDIERLRAIDARRDLPYLSEAVRSVRQALDAEHPGTALIGFAGAPFTLASYAVEGGTSKSFTRIRGLIFSDPPAAHALFRRLTETIVDVLGAQLGAGATTFQIFDSWGGMLAKPEYEQFGIPYLREIFTRLKVHGAPGVLFVNGGNHLLEVINDVEPDVVGIDWRTTLTEARRCLPGRTLQGNLDPAALLAPSNDVRKYVEQTLECGARGGYIFNLGHGILPETPLACVEAMIETVRGYRRERRQAGGEVREGARR